MPEPVRRNVQALSPQHVATADAGLIDALTAQLADLMTAQSRPSSDTHIGEDIAAEIEAEMAQVLRAETAPEPSRDPPAAKPQSAELEILLSELNRLWAGRD